MAEDIETLSMGVLVSTEQAAKSIDDFIAQTASRLNDLSKAMETNVQDITSVMTRDMQKAVNSVVDAWVTGTATLEESAKKVAGRFNLSFEEVLRNAEITQAKIIEMTAAYSARAQISAAGMGAPMSPEMIQKLEELTAQQIAYAMSQGQTAEEAARLNEELTYQAEQFASMSRLQKTATDVINMVKQKYQELGMVMPIEKQKALEDQMQKIVETGKELGRTTKEINDEMIRAGREAIPQQEKGLGKLGQLFGQLAGKVTAAFASYKIIQEAAKFIRESVQLAQESIEVTTRLTLAVREHQRAVGELSPTVAEANKEADRLSETYNIELNRAKDLVAQTLLLTENLKLTAQESFQLADASSVLAEVFGKDQLNVLKQLTNFLNTGYGQGLRQLGFDLDENKLRVEAINRGYIEFGETLDDTTKRMVGLEIIEERANELRDDVVQKNKQIAEQIKAENVELTKNKELLGKFILPLWEGMQLVGLKAVNALAQGLVVLTVKMYEFFGKIIARIETVGELVQKWQEIGYSGIKEQYGSPKAFFDQRLAANIEEVNQAVQDALGDMANAGQELGDEFADGLETGAAAAEEFQKTVTMAMDKTVMAINKFMADYNQKRQKIELDLQRRLDDITQDFQRRREQAQLNLDQKLEDIDFNAQQRRQQQTQDYYIEEQRALEDHKIEMARLESKYLMDLEDAVRERDARAVLELRRRYNQEKKEREEDFDLDNKRRKQDYEIQLKEIEYQRQLQRAKAQEQFDLDMQQLAEQEELRKAQERQAAQDRLDDLDAYWRERLRLMATALAEELGLNADMLEELSKMLLAAYGPEGWVLDIINSMYDYVNQAVQVGAGYPASSYMAPGAGTNRALTPGSTLQQQASSSYSGRTNVLALGQTRQRGGTYFATSPTLMQVGETPERIDVTRLSHATGAPREGGGGGAGRAEIHLDIRMSDGLVAEIADQTMNEVADVFVNISSNGNRGSR